jgi:integrase
MAEHVYIKVERGIVRRGSKLYVRFQKDGKTVTEVTDCETVAAARKERLRRMGRVADGRHVPVDRLKVKAGTLLDRLLEHWQVRPEGPPASLENTARCQVEKVREAFGDRPARSLTYSDFEKYVGAQVKTKAGLLRPATPGERATRGLRLGYLRKALKLALRDGLLDAVPPFPTRVDNVRQGCISIRQFDEEIAPVFDGAEEEALRFAYTTGQRIGRVLGFHIWDVDTGRREIQGEPTRGNKERPMVPLEGDAWSIVEHRLKVATASGWLFHNGDGKPITRAALYGKWKKRVQVKLGLKGRDGKPLVIHDLRRSAVVNMSDADVSEDDAMSVTGHRSTTVFRRYKIDKRKGARRAAEKLAAYMEKTRAESAQSAQQNPNNDVFTSR